MFTAVAVTLLASAVVCFLLQERIVELRLGLGDRNTTDVSANDISLLLPVSYFLACCVVQLDAALSRATALEQQLSDVSSELEDVSKLLGMAQAEVSKLNEDAAERVKEVWWMLFVEGQLLAAWPSNHCH